jgi:hypothetical protein
MSTEISYTLTGERDRGIVSSYHRKPSPIDKSKGGGHRDVAGLKAVTKRNALRFDGQGFASRFTIGFEVEKNMLSRGAVKEYELFCGFEQDGSCGYEAVTHILPLLPASTWRNKVFDMMHKAERIIDDRWSPSDKRCGGHITISVEGMSGAELRDSIRKNVGIIHALFRHRIKNYFCTNNQNMVDSDTSNVGGYHHKYQLALVKGDLLEFRLPSKFESVKQMMRRYELFYEVVNFSINNPNGSHDSLLKIVRPIILSMYEGGADKCDKIMSLAPHFRAFVLKGKVHESIENYVSTINIDRFREGLNS